MSSKSTQPFLNSVFNLYKKELHPYNLINILEKDFVKKRPIIVFSHLRWEFVKQRPQHLLERMAKNTDILFVEEPIESTENNYGTAHVIAPFPRIKVIQPRIKAGDNEELTKVIYAYSELELTSKPILWFYSASFVEMASHFEKSLVIYDCMDELAQFRGAPAELIQQEKVLLSLADLVFTSRKSLYDSKKRFHQDVHCFPSSVDQKHFAKANEKDTVIPADLAKVQHPTVGFYGVIDERLDLELIGKVAKAMPKVSFVMIGPVVKVSEADLPKAANIHYLGNKNYSELPSYLKGFDIAFMPFALNEATQFISPTKTLEFIAAFKPIVSTPIYDVERDYAKEVAIVKNTKEMVVAITHYLNETSAQKKERIELQTAVLQKTSWDKTASSMKKLIDEKLKSLAEDEESVAEYYGTDNSYNVSV